MQSPEDAVGRHRSGDAFDVYAASIRDEGDFVTPPHRKKATYCAWDCDLPFAGYARSCQRHGVSHLAWTMGKRGRTDRP